MILRVVALVVLFFATPLFSTADDLQDSYNKLKEAVEAKKDAAEIKKLAVETYALAHQLTSTPQNEALKDAVAEAQRIETYTEYALLTASYGAPPATVVDLISTLEQQNPKSKYLDEGYAPYFVALSQSGGASKITAIAEKAIAATMDREMQKHLVDRVFDELERKS